MSSELYSDPGFLYLILNRRSVKTYRDEPVDHQKLDAIVECGRHAPSGMNRQQTTFYVITDPKLLSAITRVVSEKLPAFAGVDCRYGAPALVLLTNRKDNPVALQDTACAMENMMLAACALGLGSRWINQPYKLSDDPDMRALLTPLGLTADERICASLSIGYPVGDLFPGPRPHPGNPVVWAEES